MEAAEEDDDLRSPDDLLPEIFGFGATAESEEEEEISPEEFHLRFNRPRAPTFDIDAAANNFLQVRFALTRP